jgi:hypothetical protein
VIAVATYPDTPLVTDEALYVEGGQHVVDALAPLKAGVAAGVDGSFDPAYPWRLLSASNDFATQGVTAGQLVKISSDAAVLPSPSYDDVLIIDSADGTGLNLRRKGMAAGLGLAPGTGGPTGLTFEVLTALPVIRRKSAELRARYRAEADSEFIASEDAANAVIYWILYAVFFDAARLAGSNDAMRDTFYRKADDYKSLRDERLSALDALYGVDGTGPAGRPRVFPLGDGGEFLPIPGWSYLRGRRPGRTSRGCF